MEENTRVNRADEDCRRRGQFTMTKGGDGNRGVKHQRRDESGRIGADRDRAESVQAGVDQRMVASVVASQLSLGPCYPKKS